MDKKVTGAARVFTAVFYFRECFQFSRIMVSKCFFFLEAGRCFLLVVQICLFGGVLPTQMDLLFRSDQTNRALVEWSSRLGLPR